MRIEEAILYAIMLDNRGKTTQQIADTINENKMHIRKDGNPVTSAQVYAIISRHPEVFVKEEGKIRVLL